MGRRAHDAAAAVEEACETLVDLLREGFGTIKCLSALAQDEQALIARLRDFMEEPQ